MQPIETAVLFGEFGGHSKFIFVFEIDPLRFQRLMQLLCRNRLLV
jgi:hypothetical protein